MKNIIVDFETFYDDTVSVKTMGVPNYSKAADAYIVSVVSDEVEFCGEIADLPKELGDTWIRDPGLQFWAANANFDDAFWLKYYPKPAHPWKCVLDLAAYHQLPRDLANVTRVALKHKMDKSIRDEMKGVRWESLPDERKQRLIDYCLNDGVQERKLLDVLAPMSPVEDQLAEHTRLLNRRGIHVNVEKIEKDCDHLVTLRHNAKHSLPWVDEGRAPLSYEAFAEFCRSEGINPPASLDKRDAECNAWIELHPNQAHVLKSMRLFRGSNTKLEKLKAILNNADDAGKIPLELLYCGARHTRRWSCKNINVQNLDTDSVFQEEMAELDYFKAHPDEEPGLNMREYFIPPPGKKFGILDFSQIEPRVLAWIVRNEELLAAVRMGYGVYEAHAKATMGWKGQPGTLKYENPNLYKFAKMRVLALGYGMGADRFRDTAALPPPKGIGVQLTAAEAQAQVDGFRASNPLIIKEWNRNKYLIRQAAMVDEEHIIEIAMATGDLLKHFHVKRKAEGGFESFTVRGDFTQPSHIYNLFGGLLTENKTQRMARDILGVSLLRMEHAGIPICFHAHDEIVFLLDESSAKQDLAEAKEIMAVPPEWCSDIPLGVDGGIFDHYVKLQ